ncbi:MAG TPA: FAD-dependent monooxygenase [Ktedonobacterales bacterium]|jgi:2-polyprenyl-6-methoxyphenol hydroxylase-like FAD-dependent oxidoreductase
MAEVPQNTPAALVIGAGPTGLMMASELARHGVPCRIIDKLPHASTTSKALGLHSRTLEVFEQIGVLDEALAHGLKQHGVNIYADGQRIIHISFDDLHGPYPFMLNLPQSETERILSQHLEQLGVQVERQVELIDFSQDEQAVTARLRHADSHEETVTTSWLTGCDGAHSAVRHRLNVPFSGSAYPEAFALADVKLHWPLPDDELYLFLSQDGLFAAFPMPGGRYRLIFETAAEAGEEKMPDPTLEEIQGYLNKFAPAGSTASDPAWLAAFRTHLRQAAHTRHGRAFLAGDAAHIHSPAGGQGMNTGLQDAYNLAWKLALVTAGYAPSSLLDTYESERHPVAESVMRTTDMMIKGATLRNPIAQHIRNRLVPLLVQQDFIQQRLTGQISELSINYRKSQIVAEYHHSRFNHGHIIGGPRAGDRAPDATSLLRADGTSVRLFEALRSTKHTLLLMADTDHQEESWQRLTRLADDINASYSQQINVYLVAAGRAAPASGASRAAILLDPELTLHQGYGAIAECLYLIRPDGYIGYRSYPAEAARLIDYLKQILLSER